jgi:citrate lyase subunit beta/citryl-CoA lyase
MNQILAVSGNSGPKIRSDCEITLELKGEGGINIDLVSRVKALYGQSIIQQIKEILNFFGIRDANVNINDSGALPFVIAARLEAAVRQLIDTDLEYLPEFNPEINCESSRTRQRFSRLYLPGNNPAQMINAGLHSADGLILDLEDSVAPSKKDEARILVRNALRQISFYGAERMVRINQGERGLNDLHFIIPHRVNLILIPKCETAEQIRSVENEIEKIKQDSGNNWDIFLMPIIESAAGVENVTSIISASQNVVAVAIGLEDYTADLGVQRTPEGTESLYARTRIIVAAKAAGIQPIDSVFSDVDDMDGLLKNVLSSKALGFEGMGCIHPRQISVIKRGYAPNETEIEKSKKICLAYEDAMKNGLGVIALGSKMIDPPVVARAQRIIDQAVLLGLLKKNWMEVSSEEK